MRSFLKKYWLIILLAFLATILVLLKILTSQEGPQPLPSLAPVSALRLTSVFPTQGTVALASPATAIGFTFSEPVDPTSARAQISPQLDHSFSLDASETTLFLRPVPAWEYGVNYTIVLEVSTKGDKKAAPITYTFRPVALETSELTE